MLHKALGLLGLRLKLAFGIDGDPDPFAGTGIAISEKEVLPDPMAGIGISEPKPPEKKAEAKPEAPEAEEKPQGEAAEEEAPAAATETEINGVKYQRDSDGNYLLNGVPVMDGKKVPFFNRHKEDGKWRAEYDRLKAEREQGQPEKKPEAPPQPAGMSEEEMVKQLRTHFPRMTETLEDDQVLQSYNFARAIAAQQMVPYLPMFADMVADKVKSNLRQDKDNFPHYEKFSKEIEEMFDNGFRPQIKMDPKKARQALENCYLIVTGKRVKDLTEETAQVAVKKANQEKEILGDVGNNVSNQRRGGTGPADKGLSKDQESERREMNLSIPEYKIKLHARQKKFKEQGKPVPQTVR